MCKNVINSFHSFLQMSARLTTPQINDPPRKIQINDPSLQSSRLTTPRQEFDHMFYQTFFGLGISLFEADFFQVYGIEVGEHDADKILYI